MEQDTSAKLPVEEIHARMGWDITEEGKARARRRLRAAADRHDPAALAAFKARLQARTV